MNQPRSSFTVYRRIEVWVLLAVSTLPGDFLWMLCQSDEAMIDLLVIIPQNFRSVPLKEATTVFHSRKLTQLTTI